MSEDDIRAAVGRKRGGAKTLVEGRGRRVSDVVTATPCPLRAFSLDAGVASCSTVMKRQPPLTFLDDQEPLNPSMLSGTIACLKGDRRL